MMKMGRVLWSCYLRICDMLSSFASACSGEIRRWVIRLVSLRVYTDFWLKYLNLHHLSLPPVGMTK